MSKHPPTRLGALLRLWRSVHRLTTAQMGAEIGISSSTVSRLENGRQLDMPSFIKLLQWLCRPEDGDA